MITELILKAKTMDLDKEELILLRSFKCSSEDLVHLEEETMTLEDLEDFLEMLNLLLSRTDQLEIEYFIILSFDVNGN